MAILMADDLRNRIRRALAETEGFDYDHLESHDYQCHADAILALFQSKITDHTFEGNPASSCAAERFGETCGAPWADHQLRECTHQGPDVDTWFDRTICPEPCGAMHTRCTACGDPLDGCRLTAEGGVAEPRRYDYPIGDPLPAPNTCGHSAEFHGPEAGCVECRCTSTVGHE